MLSDESIFSILSTSPALIILSIDWANKFVVNKQTKPIITNGRIFFFIIISMDCTTKKVSNLSERFAIEIINSSFP